MIKQELEVLFPQFLQINDPKLREQSENAMLIAMERGGWNGETVGKCPVTLNWPDCSVTWVEHVSDVTNICIAAYETQEKYYRRNGVPLCRDIVVAGALLHDIGKLTEFSMENGRIGHSGSYRLMRHPLAGAIIAHDAGLPDALVHLIAVHSFEGDRSYQTAESAFVRKLDIFVFENSVAGLKRL